MYDLITQAKVALWRRKAIDGTLTKEEQREAVAHLAGSRQSAFAAATSAKGTRTAKAKGKAAVDAIDPDADLLEMMEGKP